MGRRPRAQARAGWLDLDAEHLLDVAGLDRAELRTSMSAWFRGHFAAHPRRLVLLGEALERFLPGVARGTGAQELERIAERLLLAVLSNYRGRVGRALDDIVETLGPLLDDLAEQRATGRLPKGREMRDLVSDLEALRDAARQLVDLRTHALEFLGGPEGPGVAKLRDELELQLGAAPSLRPAGAVVPPPGPRVAARPGRAGDPFAAELERLLEARTSLAFLNAGHRLLRLTGGDRRAAVLRVLAARSGPDADRGVVALLRAAPAARQPRGAAPGGNAFRVLERGQLPGGEPGVFQEAVTGTPYEWTGRLDEPVGLRDTVGIDGINDGWVRDAKSIQGPLAESAHKLGELHKVFRYGDPSQYRGQYVENVLGVKVEEIADLMRRQARFAQENGLKGIDWVCSSTELAGWFEGIFAEFVRPHVKVSGLFRGLE